MAEKLPKVDSSEAMSRIEIEIKSSISSTPSDKIEEPVQIPKQNPQVQDDPALAALISTKPVIEQPQQMLQPNGTQASAMNSQEAALYREIENSSRADWQVD